MTGILAGLRIVEGLGSTEVLHIYLSALGHAFDPHSDYMAPADAKNFDIHNVKLKLNGIGAQLRRERRAHIGHRCECRDDQRHRCGHLLR